MAEYGQPRIGAFPHERLPGNRRQALSREITTVAPAQNQAHEIVPALDIPAAGAFLLAAVVVMVTKPTPDFTGFEWAAWSFLVLGLLATCSLIWFRVQLGGIRERVGHSLLICVFVVAFLLMTSALYRAGGWHKPEKQ